MNTTDKVFWLTLSGTVFIILLFGIYEFSSMRQFRETGVAGQAQVIEIWQSPHRSLYNRFRIIHRMALVYVLAGETYELRTNNPNGRYSVGDTVRIIHDQENPQRFVLHDPRTDTWVTSFIDMLSIASLVFSVPILGRLVSKKQARKRG